MADTPTSGSEELAELQVRIRASMRDVERAVAKTKKLLKGLGAFAAQHATIKIRTQGIETVRKLKREIAAVGKIGQLAAAQRALAESKLGATVSRKIAASATKKKAAAASVASVEKAAATLSVSQRALAESKLSAIVGRNIAATLAKRKAAGDADVALAKRNTSILKGLHRRVLGFGKSAAQKRVIDLKLGGGTKQAIAQAQRLADQLDAMKVSQQQRAAAAKRAAVIEKAATKAQIAAENLRLQGLRAVQRAQAQVRAFGKGRGGQLAEAARLKGFSSDQIASIRKAGNELDRLEKEAKQATSAERVLLGLQKQLAGRRRFTGRERTAAQRQVVGLRLEGAPKEAIRQATALARRLDSLKRRAKFFAGARKFTLKLATKSFMLGLKLAEKSVRFFARNTWRLLRFTVRISIGGAVGTLRRFSRIARGILNKLRPQLTMKILFIIALRRILRELRLASVAIIKLGSDSEEVANLFKVAMGRMIAPAEKFAQTLNKTLRASILETRKSLGEFNVLLRSLSLNPEQALAMSKSLTQLGLDLSSFFNISQSDAFTKIKAGIVGEVEPLRRLGVVLLQGRVKQLAYAEGIAAVGQELTEVQKIQARFLLLMRDTKAAQGDLARTSHQFANSSRQLKNRVIDLAAAIGRRILPSVNRLVIRLRDLIPAAAEVGAAVDKAVIIIKAGLADLGKVFQLTVTRLELVFDKLVLSLLTNAGRIAQLLKLGFARAFVGVIDLAARFSNKLIDVLSGKITIGEALAGIFDKSSMGAVFEDAAKFIKARVEKLEGRIAKVQGERVDLLTERNKKLSAVVSERFNTENAITDQYAKQTDELEKQEKLAKSMLVLSGAAFARSGGGGGFAGRIARGAGALATGVRQRVAGALSVQQSAVSGQSGAGVAQKKVLSAAAQAQARTAAFTKQQAPQRETFVDVLAKAQREALALGDKVLSKFEGVFAKAGKGLDGLTAGTANFLDRIKTIKGLPSLLELKLNVADAAVQIRDAVVDGIRSVLMDKRVWGVATAALGIGFRKDLVPLGLGAAGVVGSGVGFLANRARFKKIEALIKTERVAVGIKEGSQVADAARTASRVRSTASVARATSKLPVLGRAGKEVGGAFAKLGKSIAGLTSAFGKVARGVIKFGIPGTAALEALSATVQLTIDAHETANQLELQTGSNQAFQKTLSAQANTARRSQATDSLLERLRGKRLEITTQISGINQDGFTLGKSFPFGGVQEQTDQFQAQLNKLREMRAEVVELINLAETGFFPKDFLSDKFPRFKNIIEGRRQLPKVSGGPLTRNAPQPSTRPSGRLTAKDELPAPTIAARNTTPFPPLTTLGHRPGVPSIGDNLFERKTRGVPIRKNTPVRKPAVPNQLAERLRGFIKPPESNLPTVRGEALDFSKKTKDLSPQARNRRVIEARTNPELTQRLASQARIKALDIEGLAKEALDFNKKPSELSARARNLRVAAARAELAKTAKQRKREHIFGDKGPARFKLQGTGGPDTRLAPVGQAAAAPPVQTQPPTPQADIDRLATTIIEKLSAIVTNTEGTGRVGGG